ncbi:hypothetical protein [Peptostreptococcus stomatis]|nr:hypothetical protein [Peptostreptococcus stomatis]
MRKYRKYEKNDKYSNSIMYIKKIFLVCKEKYLGGIDGEKILGF